MRGVRAGFTRGIYSTSANVLFLRVCTNRLFVALVMGNTFMVLLANGTGNKWNFEIRCYGGSKSVLDCDLLVCADYLENI